MRIFATAPDGSPLEAPLVQLHPLRRPFARVKARNKLATNLINPDFQASVLHWLLFDEHEERREELSKFLTLLHRSKRNAKTALRLRLRSRMEKAKSFFSKLVSSRAKNHMGNIAKVSPEQAPLAKTAINKVDPVLPASMPVSVPANRARAEAANNNAAPPTTTESIQRSDSMHVDDLDDDDQVAASDM